MAAFSACRFLKENEYRLSRPVSIESRRMEEEGRKEEVANSEPATVVLITNGCERGNHIYNGVIAQLKLLKCSRICTALAFDFGELCTYLPLSQGSPASVAL